ncbi:hypothetical protein SAMN06298216_3087 [Spirosomataceae bacterium TFI 002]|nr:hypothetical protein SAMN06298216_3087 [Spirosomataceae bacterium TFI 002]
MKYTLLLAIVLFGSSCSMKNYSQMKPNSYYLVDIVDFEDFSEVILEKAVNKSKATLLLNEENGDFTGQLNGIAFSGNLELGKTSSGFVKGFYVATQLGYLQSGSHDDKSFDAFTSKLANAKRLYFYNNALIDGKWAVLEISIEGDSKMMFLKKK